MVQFECPRHSVPCFLLIFGDVLFLNILNSLPLLMYTHAANHAANHGLASDGLSGTIERAIGLEQVLKIRILTSADLPNIAQSHRQNFAIATFPLLLDFFPAAAYIHTREGDGDQRVEVPRQRIESGGLGQVPPRGHPQDGRRHCGRQVQEVLRCR